MQTNQTRLGVLGEGVERGEGILLEPPPRPLYLFVSGVVSEIVKQNETLERFN